MSRKPQNHQPAYLPQCLKFLCCHYSWGLSFASPRWLVKYVKYKGSIGRLVYTLTLITIVSHYFGYWGKQSVKTGQGTGRFGDESVGARTETTQSLGTPGNQTSRRPRNNTLRQNQEESFKNHSFHSPTHSSQEGTALIHNSLFYHQ